jgi:hypothetical protein
VLIFPNHSLCDKALEHNLKGKDAGSPFDARQSEESITSFALWNPVFAPGKSGGEGRGARLSKLVALSLVHVVGATEDRVEGILLHDQSLITFFFKKKAHRKPVSLSENTY